MIFSSVSTSSTLIHHAPAASSLSVWLRENKWLHNQTVVLDRNDRGSYDSPNPEDDVMELNSFDFITCSAMIMHINIIACSAVLSHANMSTPQDDIAATLHIDQTRLVDRTKEHGQSR